jgi:hypothetical protein
VFKASLCSAVQLWSANRPQVRWGTRPEKLEEKGVDVWGKGMSGRVGGKNCTGQKRHLHGASNEREVKNWLDAAVEDCRRNEMAQPLDTLQNGRRKLLPNVRYGKNILDVNGVRCAIQATEGKILSPRDNHASGACQPKHMALKPLPVFKPLRSAEGGGIRHLSWPPEGLKDTNN